MLRIVSVYADAPFIYQYIIYENAYLSVTFIKALHSYAFCAISVMQSFYSRKSSNSSLSSTKIEEPFASSNVVR